MNTRFAQSQSANLNCRRTAFTLVELLVVIAVITVLAALLLPTFAAAKLNAQQTQCLSNLRQLGLANSSYMTEFGKDVPYQESDPFYSGWAEVLISYATNAASVQLCPSAPRNPSAGVNVDTPGAADQAATIYQPVTTIRPPSPPFQCSYAFNGWFYTGPLLFQSTPVIAFDPGTTNNFASERSVRYPSQTPVFADGMWPETFPLTNNSPSTNLYLGQTASGDSLDLMMMRLTIARHDGKPAAAAPRRVDTTQPLPGGTGLAIYDGHVEKSPLEKLWNYYWSCDWRVPHPRPD